MSSVIQKEWAAVKGDEIIRKADDKNWLLSDLREKGMDPDDYDIVALPKPHFSVFV